VGLESPPATNRAHAAASSESAGEPLLDPSSERLSMFPIRYDGLWAMYKQAVASFWTVEEVDLADDLRDFARLSPEEQHFVESILAFFATADGIVVENIGLRFLEEVQAPEARAFYSFQMAMETVHGEMYSLMLTTLVKDAEKQRRLLNAMDTVPAVRKKAEWALRWVSSSKSFAERLVAFACVEGIFFSGSFCAVFWLKKRALMPGLSFSNALISRDEGLHCDFACALHALLQQPADPTVVADIVREAVEIEKEFICESLPAALIGMNSKLMGEYIEFVSDRLLVALGQERIYGAANPFDWMELISIPGRSNFFERRESEYQKAGVMAALQAGPRGWSNFVFTTDEDF